MSLRSPYNLLLLPLALAACGGETAQKEPAQPAALRPVGGTESDQKAEETDEASAAEEEPEPSVEKAAAPVQKDILERVTPEARASFEHGVNNMSSDPETALSAFQAATRYSPEFYTAYHNAAVILEGKGRLLEARKAYEKALSGRSDFSPAVIGLAALMERQGDRSGAVRLLKRRLDAQPKDTVLRSAYAESLARHGQVDEAREQAIKVLRTDERSARAMLVMGMVYRRKEMLELSELALGQALEIDPKLGVAYAELGLVLLARDQKNQAVAAFERAAAESPTVAAIHNNLGALRNEVGAYKGAVEALQRAVELDGARPEYYLNLGNALRGDQRYPEAEAAYQKALQVGGGSPKALFNLGILYLDNEMPGKEEIPRYRQCIDYLKQYEGKVKVEEVEKARIAEYVETAEKAIEREEKRLERQRKREERDAKRKAEDAAEASEASEPAPAGEGGEAVPAEEAPAADGPTTRAPEGALVPVAEAGNRRKAA